MIAINVYMNNKYLLDASGCLGSVMPQAVLGIIRYCPEVQAFSTAFTRGLPHGVVAAVHLPETFDDVAPAILQRLHPDERIHAEGLKGKRKVEWIGGRLAARGAVKALGTDLGPLLSDSFGAPIAPASLTISIAHKERLAIALVARRKHGVVGVDLEFLGRDRREIAPKILVETEQCEVSALSEHRQWTAILLRFAIKEAIYKALAPRLQRYIGFEEACISNVANGGATVHLQLKPGDSPKHIEAHYNWMPEGLVTTVRARWD
jgi:4'-phosphopantetheinyl transferase EntD